MERQLAAFVAAARVELIAHGVLVDADAHGRDLKRTLQHLVPHENVTVQAPVVVVGGAAIVGLAAALEVVADLHQEHRAVLAADGVLALFRRVVGPAVLQLLRRDEIDLALQLCVQAREGNLQRVVRLDHRADNGAHGLAQILLVAVLAADDLLPVPLVDIDGMEIVDLLVAADSVHVGEESLADVELIALERQTLPLGQRVNHLTVRADVGNIERNGTLHPVEVIVQTGIFVDEQRGRHAAQIERLPEVHLKIALDEFNRALHLIDGQRRVITLRNDDFAHSGAPLSNKFPIIIMGFLA